MPPPCSTTRHACVRPRPSAARLVRVVHVLRRSRCHIALRGRFITTVSRQCLAKPSVARSRRPTRTLGVGRSEKLEIHDQGVSRIRSPRPLGADPRTLTMMECWPPQARGAPVAGLGDGARRAFSKARTAPPPRPFDGLLETPNDAAVTCAAFSGGRASAVGPAFAGKRHRRVARPRDSSNCPRAANRPRAGARRG